MLVPDPCSLLRPITPDLRDRWLALSEDRDGQGGRITDQSRCEARLALTLEIVGLLEPTVTRPHWGDAGDGYGQVWDFKAPHSQAAIVHRIESRSSRAATPPPQGYPGAFDVQTEAVRTIGQQQLGKGVVFDLRRLTVAQAQELINVVTADSNIDAALVRFYPREEDLSSFGAGAHGN
ncbi:MAG: hypothetical protein H0T43_04405 [Solirubrobacterales bacterium]|nr:hypothetical protein [Solirubrobacterales bacterium]